MLLVANTAFGIYIGLLSNVRRRVLYQPIFSTVPSIPFVLIQSPSLKGRLKKSMNPEKKFWEMFWVPKARPTPAPPPKAARAVAGTP